MKVPYTDVQLDALRELANIGSGNAATALSSMLGREVDVTIPDVVALPLADAVQAHATTNGLLLVYAIVTGRWAVWS